MTDFLLGTLDDRTREQILDRLGEEEGYFERMAALEEELILRWHHGTLSAADRASFAQAYASPSRRARVDESAVLLQAARAWAPRKIHTRAAVTRKPSRWTAGAAAAVVVLGLSSFVYLTSRQRVPAAPIRVELSAVGQRAGGSKGYDRVDLPPNATAIVFVLTPTVVPAGSLTAELQARDRSGAPLRLRPVLENTVAGTVLTITVSAEDLPDGDYVLTVAAETNPAETVATHSLRVIHATR